MAHIQKKTLPSLRGDDYSAVSVNNYLAQIQGSNMICGYGKFGTAADNSTISTGTFCPIRQKIVWPPFYNGTVVVQNIVDCMTGVNTVTNPTATAVTSTSSFSHGVFSPTQGRIYWIPYSLSVNRWYYQDCRTGSLVGYEAPEIPATSFYGGVYSPKQNRIYLLPYTTTGANWYYIDCSIAIGSVVSYAHGTSYIGQQRGGAYHPVFDRIYLGRAAESGALQSVTTWHYIDCSNGSVVSYTGLTAPGTGGARFSPLQNGIYLLGNGRYVDSTGSMVSCTASGPGAYSPADNRIWIDCSKGTALTSFYYMDCNSGSRVLYSAPTDSGWTSSGAVFCPIRNRIYFGPSYGIQVFSNSKVSPALMSQP